MDCAARAGLYFTGRISEMPSPLCVSVLDRASEEASFVKDHWWAGVFRTSTPGGTAAGRFSV